MADESQGIVYGKYYTRLTIGTFERPKPFASPEFKNKYIVFLPIPNELRDDTTVSYTNVNLETVGDLANGKIISGAGAAVLRKSGDMVAGAINLGADALAAATRSDAGEKIVGGLADGVASLFPAEQITSAIQQSIGLAPNPNPSVAFQGPILRDFSYSWAFYPKSKEESAAIDKLIKILKTRALPKNWAKGSAAILEYPDMCQLNFFPWDEDGVAPWYWSDKSIIRFKKCVMQSVNANYNPFGTPAFFEGSNLPVSYQLTIAFREIEYMLSHDWDDVKLGNIGSGVIEEGEAVGKTVAAAKAPADQVKTGAVQAAAERAKAVL